MTALPPSCTKRAIPFLFTFLCAGVAAAEPAPPPPPPQAQPDAPPTTESKSGAAKEAQDHFQRARQLFDEGDYGLALVEFQRAYDVSPNYRVLYNIAQVEIQLFHYAAARVALEKFLKDGGSEIPAPRKAQAENDLRMLAERTAYLRIVTTPPSDVSLDDQPAVSAPFAEHVLVNAGQRKIVANRAGYSPVTRYVTLAGGDRKELTIELVPVPDAPKSVVVVPTGPTTHANYTPAIVGWIATGALAIGTGIVGGLYLSKEAEIDRLSNPAVPVNRQTSLDASASANRLAIAADVLGLATIGAGIVSLYFTLRPPTTESGRPANVGTFRVRPGLGGVTGSF
ncbi:MAG TPA: tetratricopeptide repeat protein [Labilithrix sp.]|nr:tetratricopeptide repeat protein [Labilithrix sp.]